MAKLTNKEKQAIVNILTQYQFQGKVVNFTPEEVDRVRDEVNLAFDLKQNPRGVRGGIEMTNKIEESLGKDVAVSDTRALQNPDLGYDFDDLRLAIQNGEVLYDK